MSEKDERCCYAEVRVNRLELFDDLECFDVRERVVVIAEAEYERLKARQIPEKIDVVDGLRAIAAELSSIAVLLHSADESSLGGKALDLGVVVKKLAEKVEAKRLER